MNNEFNNDPPPSRSATARYFRSRAKLHSAVPTEPNKRHRAFLIFVLGVVAATAMQIAVNFWLDANTTYEGECAAVAKIDRTHDVIVCVRGIKQRYPASAPPRIPGRSA